MHVRDLRFALACLLPLTVAVAAWHSLWAAWAAAAVVQVGLALIERAAPHWHSPPGEAQSRPWFSACLRLHALWQVGFLFWPLQAAYAVFLLEAINYIEHYGLRRRMVNGRPEPFALQHAWNADHALTNCFIVNLQRHSDHHQHAWKPYATLNALPGPQLPSSYAGCLFLACVPPLWFRAMHPRLAALT